MTLIEFVPENGLERIIVDAKRGANSIAAMMETIVSSTLFVPSKSEVLPDASGFDPVLLDKDSDPLVAAFSSASRVDVQHEVAKYVLQMNGSDFFRRLPPGYGVIINPGYTAQLIMPPPAISDLKDDLRRRGASKPRSHI